MAGFTSHMPFSRTPPQGPLRSVLGQFIGQDMPVRDNWQSPHILQSNMNPLAARSMAVTGRSIRLPMTPRRPRRPRTTTGLNVA